MKRYRCPCGYIYDPDVGDPQTRIPPGTPFERLPPDWICPRCGYEPRYFTPLGDPDPPPPRRG
ncbi:rubredoxin [Desulfatiferula olefinivorans]